MRPAQQSSACSSISSPILLRHHKPTMGGWTMVSGTSGDGSVPRRAVTSISIFCARQPALAGRGVSAPGRDTASASVSTARNRRAAARCSGRGPHRPWTRRPPTMPPRCCASPDGIARPHRRTSSSSRSRSRWCRRRTPSALDHGARIADLGFDRLNLTRSAVCSSYPPMHPGHGPRPPQHQCARLTNSKL